MKDRIIEQLAVARLKPDAAGPILCFVGPPGVGKTSLGHSIARALGRALRAHLGGRRARRERDPRATAAPTSARMPGTIVRAIRDAGAMNPVLMVDEIDKMGSDVRGDPSSAMLEVLDPAQNSTFRDHYLDLPLDLSRVLFLCTANVLETIPGAAAGPDGGDPPLGLHRGGEAPHRPALPAAAPDRGGRPAGRDCWR